VSRRNRRGAYLATQTRRCLRCPGLIRADGTLFCPRCQRTEVRRTVMEQPGAEQQHARIAQTP
jgi:uncharacterized Zn finger protein (UPF0148 family)